MSTKSYLKQVATITRVAILGYRSLIQIKAFFHMCIYSLWQIPQILYQHIFKNFRIKLKLTIRL